MLIAKEVRLARCDEAQQRQGKGPWSLTMHEVARRARVTRGHTGTCRWELAVRAIRP